MAFWTDKEEVDKYIERIKNEVDGKKVEFNLHFWVAKEDNHAIGIIGLCDPLPKALPFAKSDMPGEIKILYVNNTHRGKGIGRKLVDFIEKEAIRQGYKELLVRSVERYRETAYGFYKRLGYVEVGTITNENSNSMQVFEKLL